MKKITLSLFTLLSGFVNAQVTIGEGVRLDTNAGLSTPISIYFGYSLSQQIYTADEIGGAIRINQLKFYTASTINSNLSNTGDIDIWIGHTSASTFQNEVSSTGAGWLPVAQQQRVLTTGTFTYYSNELIFTLDTPFDYNGTDNIVITFDENRSGNNGSNYRFYQTPDYTGDVSLINRNDSINPNPFSPPTNYTGPNSTSTTEVQAKKYKAIVTIIGDALSVDDFKTVGDAVLYPNPANDKVAINTKLNIESLEVFDINGKNLTANTNFNNNVLDINQLATGVYMVKIKYKEGITSTKKLLKK